MLKGFKEFLLRGNVIDLAVALVIGLAFLAVVNAFTDSFLTPLINLLGGGGEFGGSFTVNGQTFAWGTFLSEVITFLLTAAAVYFVVVVPVRRIRERRERLGKAGLAEPTQEELLIEIRDLLRAERGGGRP